MREAADDKNQWRVLALAPTVRDGEVTRALLAGAGLQGEVFSSLLPLCNEIGRGVGALLLTTEAIGADGFGELVRMLAEQPSWSDLPVVLLVNSRQYSHSAEEVLTSLRNVTLLERPAPLHSVDSALRAAIAARRRQYQVRDHIAASIRGEQHAMELQERLAIALEASQLGAFHCPMPPGHIEWNTQCKAHFGLDADAEIDFERFYEMIHPEDRPRTREAVEQCVFKRKTYDIEYRVVWPNSQVRWIRATGRTYFDAEERPIRFDGTTEDITERKAAVTALLEAERNARAEAERVSQMKDEFLATLSHELRTPLNAIFGWTQILKMGPDDAALVKEGIEVIDRNVRIQTQLIEELLDMSRIISGKVRLEMRSVDLHQLVQEAIEAIRPAAEAKQLKLQWVLDPQVGLVHGDPNRLQQVMWNLLTNAIKFTPKEGEILVVLKRVDSHVEISVADTGMGISPQFLPHLFERFSQADASTTRKFGGLGIGLSIVKNLVELHGGTIEAHSQGDHHGATFKIQLPIRAMSDSADEDRPRVNNEEAAHNFDDRLRGLKVLVVDDEPDSRQLVLRFLRQCGATTALAASAAEGQLLLSSFQPDVIVSDIGMPDEDGYQFIRKVRQRGHRTPAVALTAFARAEDRIRSMQAGFQTHLPKPIEPAELVAVIASLAGRF